LVKKYDLLIYLFLFDLIFFFFIIFISSIYFSQYFIFCLFIYFYLFFKNFKIFFSSKIENRLVIQPTNINDELEIINFRKILQKELVLKNTPRMSYILFAVQNGLKVSDRNMIQIENEKNLTNNLLMIKDYSVLEKPFVNLLQRARKIGENTPKPTLKILEKLDNLKEEGKRFVSMREYQSLFVEACRESCLHFTTEIFENITQLLHSKKKKILLYLFYIFLFFYFFFFISILYTIHLF
jgi:hypothetical protein